MDVMRPDLYQIGNRCYRRNPLKESQQAQQRPSEPGPYREEDEDEFRRSFDEGEAEEEVKGLTERPDGSWRLEMHLPAQLFPMLIGRRGETKKRMEIETRTQVRIPRQGVAGPLVVEGRERAGVLSARTRIEVLAAAAREKQPFTHFLSLPMAAAAADGFAAFCEQVLDACGGDRGVEASLFQTPAKLHLTLGVMALLSEAEVAAAARVLEECRPALQQMTEGGLRVDLAGLEYMNDDPSEVDVLYIQVHDHDRSGRLQRLADFLVARFEDAGLMTRQYERVKLHLTAMNTLFRKDPSGATAAVHGDARRRPRESFDATHLLRRFKEFEFATNAAVPGVHLSQRFSTGEDGYYTPAATLLL